MKNVVIIGGGFTGAKCARLLQNDFNVSLIDSKDYFEFTPGILRTLIDKEHLTKIQIPHKNYLQNAKLITGCVQSVTDKNVTYDNKTIPYDYLIIASGSTYNRPIKEQDTILATRGKTLHDYAEKLFEAKSVLIIGGGLVGVELAAEIITHYPDKEITIAHAGSTLLERMPIRAQQYAQKFLEKRNVTIAFKEKVTQKNGKNYISEKGTTFTPDLAFLCTGIKPNTTFMKKELSKTLDEKGYVTVNNTLQLDGYGHIFVGGDAICIPEEKTAQNAEKHADIITENIKRLDKDKTLQAYTSKPRVMDLSLGKYDGIITYKNHTLTGFLPGLLKSVVEWKTMRRYQ